MPPAEGEVLERAVRRIEKHLRRRGLVRIDDDGDGDPRATSPPPPSRARRRPPGRSGVRGLQPLEPHALAYDKPL